MQYAITIDASGTIHERASRHKKAEVHPFDAKRLSRRALSRRRQMLGNAACGVVAEALEGRRLLTVTPSLSAGALTVTSSAADYIGIGQISGTPDTIVVSDGSSVVGSYAANTVSSITVNAGSGDDTISVETQFGVPFATGGNKAVTLGVSIDAGTGNDLVSGGDQADTIIGGDGQDTVQGNGGNDLIKGDVSATNSNTNSSTTYNDTLEGDDGSDTILGQYGNDSVEGDNGADSLFGDFVVAGAVYGHGIGYGDVGTPDTLHGGDGGDYLQGDSDSVSITDGYGGDDLLMGGGDNDTLYGEAPNSSSTYGDDVIDCDGGADIAYGGYGNDSITGGDDNDILRGGDDNDTIDGGADTDSLFGDRGNDSIIGGSQNDTLYGGDGDDLLFGDGGPISFMESSAMT